MSMSLFGTFAKDDANGDIFRQLRLIVYIYAFISCLCPTVNASLQAHRPSFSLSKPCDKPCFNGGSCLNGTCLCGPGWTGSQCESCFGRVKKTAGRGFLTDGPLAYSASSRCIWIIDHNSTSPLLLRLEEFSTECCWDHLYVYDGDGVYNRLLAAFSGNLPGREVVATTGKAVVYFISDLAFNLSGFNISYTYDECIANCSSHGTCVEGLCDCDHGYFGDACEHQTCLSDMNDKEGPCQRNGHCLNGKCVCPKWAHGDHCQALSATPVWDTLYTKERKFFAPRASHKAVLTANEVWIYGGVQFESRYQSEDLVIFNIDKSQFYTLQYVNTPPLPRYDHSVAILERELYVFGGVVNQSYVTNELWRLDMDTLKWTLESPHNNSPFAVPMAVAGHTAHFIGNELFVFFGYNPYQGYAYQVQAFNIATRQWRKIATDSLVLGRFGHSSVLFHEANKRPAVLVYGGYNAPLNSYSYAITDELLMFDPNEQIWSNLGRGGTPLFRHSAVLLDGIMIIVGGNSHNESSTMRQPDCYSGQVLAYDPVCKSWLKSQASYPGAELNRYGHIAVANDDHMFVMGGFNGRMLNDVLKYTPAQCDSQATSAEECETHAYGVRCVYVNKTCKKASPSSSYRQPFTSFIKSENPRLQATCDDTREYYTKTCADIKECTECLSRTSCGWCESTQSCVNGDIGCVDGLSTDARQCPLTLNVGGVTKKLKNSSAKLRPCHLAVNCFSCRELSHCSWFSVETKHICVSLVDEAMLIAEHRRLEAEQLALLSNAAAQSSSLLPAAQVVKQSTPIDLPKSSSALAVNNNTCPIPCSGHNACHSCIQSQCMWCPSTRRCVGMDTYMISFPYGQCQSWITAANTNHACQLDPYDCSVQKTCTECQSVGPRCGWCDDGSETGLGKCVPGSESGPLEMGSCPLSRWFFTGQPTCQCNGHSRCTNNSTISGRCRKCADKTRGEHCDQCESGYYGDPRNGGSCRECQCNGEATTCNPESGDCYCFTKGVTGAHCDKCEPKYIGDPKNKKPCTYELMIDFIFTFKLDGNDTKDKYVNQINFYSTPYKRDTDVQFNIVCDHSDANVSIMLTSQSFEGHEGHTKQLMLRQACTALGIKRTYSAADPGFAFGTDANTTFYVKVSDFVTPIKIQISFAQSPPINWVLFFVIFAACFIVLLVVAGLLWMIKLRVEWYRNLRRRHDEIEEMASRPFASVQLELSANHSTAHATPISVEPCLNYQSGIYTLVVRLPTGGKPHTPYRTSGLAVASALCQLTQAQLALLQPPDDVDKRQNRKHTLRRFIPFIRSS